MIIWQTIVVDIMLFGGGNTGTSRIFCDDDGSCGTALLHNGDDVHRVLVVLVVPQACCLALVLLPAWLPSFGALTNASHSPQTHLA
jgi:hypothetical protein